MSDRNSNLPEEDAEELYETAPCGFLSTLPDGAIIKANRTLELWSGFGRERLLRSRFQDLLTVPGKIYYETHVAPLLRMQGFVNEIAFELAAADGARVPVLVNTVQKRDAGGEPLVNRLTVFNASDRRRYEIELLRARREAERASQAKTDLLHVIGHDIRNPLSGVLIAARRLEKLSASAEQERYVRHLRAATQRLLDLTANVLDHSQLEAGTFHLREGWFDPRELVEQVIESHLSGAEEKTIGLSAEIDANVPPRLFGDRIKLGQVLANLVANSIKFTSQGSVTLRLRAEEASLREVDLAFAVEDTGIGIDRDRIGRIFGAFEQGGKEIGVRYGGTGLGLAISRKILALYASDISVESTAGRGSAFSFRVRLRSDGSGPSPRGADK